jgi:hypothetical protein
MTGEETSLHAVVRLPNDQQLAAVLLKDHRLLSAVARLHGPSQ